MDYIGLTLISRMIKFPFRFHDLIHTFTTLNFYVHNLEPTNKASTELLKKFIGMRYENGIEKRAHGSFYPKLLFSLLSGLDTGVFMSFIILI